MTGMTTFAETELAGERIAAELVPTGRISGDDETDTALLREMAEDAKRYITSFSWCEAVHDSYFGGGFGGIFAIFFFHIRPGRSDVDPWIWVIVGDIPAAYLPLSDSESPAEAFRTYMHGMSKWVELARKGITGTYEQGVPPVNVPATPEWAEKVNQKLYGLTLTVKPLFEEDGDSSESVQ
jgi:hypothetical protein